MWLATTQLGGWIVPSDPKATAPEMPGTWPGPVRPWASTPTIAAAAHEPAAGGPDLVAIDEADAEVGGLAPATRAGDLPAPAPQDAPR